MRPHGRIERLGGLGETPARAWRRRTLRGAASSVGRIALLFGLPASLPRLVRRSPDRIRGFRQSLPGPPQAMSEAPTGAEAPPQGGDRSVAVSTEEQRRAKVERLRQAGVDPYPHSFPGRDHVEEIEA